MVLYAIFWVFYYGNIENCDALGLAKKFLFWVPPLSKQTEKETFLSLNDKSFDMRLDDMIERSIP